MKPTKKQELLARIGRLERSLLEARAQYASSYGAAFDRIEDALPEKYHGSAVILQLSALGGKELIPPVAIRDGLSDDTIRAIRNDLRRSFSLATMVSPAMALGE